MILFTLRKEAGKETQERPSGTRVFKSQLHLQMRNRRKPWCPQTAKSRWCWSRVSMF